MSRDGGVIVLRCSGSAETESFEQLARVLETVHADAIARPTESVVADLTELSFATSSCLKAFVSWLHSVKALDSEHRYKVLFKTNPEYSWQRRSLRALKSFAQGVVEIDAETPS